MTDANSMKSPEKRPPTLFWVLGPFGRTHRPLAWSVRVAQVVVSAKIVISTLTLAIPAQSTIFMESADSSPQHAFPRSSPAVVSTYAHVAISNAQVPPYHATADAEALPIGADVARRAQNGSNPRNTRTVSTTTTELDPGQMPDPSLGAGLPPSKPAEAYIEWWGAKGDGTADDSPAFQAAIDSSVPRIRLLAKRYRLASPINLTGRPAGPLVIEGVGWGISGAGSILVCDTGTVCLDTAGSAYVTFRDFSLDAGRDTPSTVGILYARTERSRYSSFCSLENIRISLRHIPTANGGVGTIGIYNFASENWRFRGGWISADLPVVLTSTNLYSIESPFQTVISGQSSMSVAELSGGIALTALGGPAVTLHTVADIELGDTYMLKSGYNDYEFAIMAHLAVGIGHTGSIEGFKRFLTTDSSVRGLHVTSRIVPSAGKSLIRLDGSTEVCCASIWNSDIRFNLGAAVVQDLVDYTGVRIYGVLYSTLSLGPLQTFSVGIGHVDGNIFITQNTLSSITVPKPFTGTANGNLILASDGIRISSPTLTCPNGQFGTVVADQNGVLSVRNCQ